MKLHIRRAVLLVMKSWSNIPMPYTSLVSAVQVHLNPLKANEAAIKEEVEDLKVEGYVQSAVDAFSRQTTWTLTAKGVHTAQNF